MFLTTVIRFRPVHTRRRRLQADKGTALGMPCARQVLEVRRAHVIHVLGVERPQLVCRIGRQAAGIVGALEVFLGGVERHRLVEIEIAHVIDRQFFVEAEAVGEVEFHGLSSSELALSTHFEWCLSQRDGNMLYLFYAPPSSSGGRRSNF
ncbi:hypothetical protein D3C76_914440 [compost metagenome]